MIKPIPNLIVFRIPDEDGIPTFVEAEIDELGNIDNNTAWTFTLDDPEDSYNSLGLDEIVLAQKVDGIGCTHLACFKLGKGLKAHEILKTMDGAIALTMMVQEHNNNFSITLH